MQSVYSLKSYLKIAFLFCFTLVTLFADASHLIGGYMNYEFLRRAPNGDLVYTVRLNLYRDALNSDIEFQDNIDVGIYLNNDNLALTDVVTLKTVITRNVDPPGSVDCDYYEKAVKIEYRLYEGQVILKPYTQGYHLSYVQCCRNEQNNITQDGTVPSQGQTYHCFIPNTTYENSSPFFYGVPSPFMCVDDTASFLFDAVDKDGDSIVYEIMRPYAGGSVTLSSPAPEPNLTRKALQYKPGYNYVQPFGAGGYVFVDRSTARTLMMSPAQGRFVVGVQATEYRNGEFLSTIRMDLQIDVLACPVNEPPVIYSDTTKRFIIEEGEELCFDVYADDKEGDNVNLTGRGVLLGDGDTAGITQATFTDKNVIASVMSTFCWTPGCGMARDNPYYVYFTAEDNGCPPKRDHLDVEIVVTAFEGATDLRGRTSLCRYNAYEYTLHGGGATSTYEWEVEEGTIVGSKTDSTIMIDWDGTGTGKVRVREVTKNGCFGDWVEIDITINPTPELPIILGKDTVCESEVGLTYSARLNAGNTYYWSATNAVLGSINQNIVTVSSYTPPSFTLFVSETNSTGCTSDTAELEVFVSTPSPTIEGPLIVCPNSSGIVYDAQDGMNGSVYAWSVSGGDIASGDGSASVAVDWYNEGLGSLSVVETNRFGCTSSIVTLVVDKNYDLGSLDIIGLTDVCEFDQGVEYSIEGLSNGSRYEWNITGGTQVSGDSTGEITVDWGATGLGRVSAIQRAYDVVNGRECASSETLIDVNIHPLPTADQIEGTVTMCQYSDTMTYTIRGFANSTYEWTLGGSSLGIVGQGTNTIKVVWNQAGTFSLSVMETSEFDCEGVLVDTLITIYPKPTTGPILGEMVICPEDTEQKPYTVSGFNTSTYTWNVIGEETYTGQGTDQIVVDWDLLQDSGQLWVVEVSDQGCLGDTMHANIVFDQLELDLRNVSVGLPDDRMEINWELVDKRASTSTFFIQKRVANSSQEWTDVAAVSGNTFTYLETNINTDETTFEYRTRAVNKCGTEVYSEMHTNILLSGVQDENFNSILNFSNYLGWENGVEYYDLFGSENKGTYRIVEVGISPLSTITLAHDPRQYIKCFRVEGVELDGDSTTSWSNELCFYFSPEVIVPNAFTPNNDGLNDGFGVKGIAIKDFKMQVYNRWGEMIYESEDLYEKWIPEYRNEDVQMGTYIYLIKYTDYQDKVYQKSGTINLLR